MSLLLDTCALLALQDGGAVLSEEARTQLELPGSLVFISAISAFEIGQKRAAGKLALPFEASKWFAAMLKQHQVQEIPVTSEICMAAADLPLVHRDPFDRLIVATALVHGLVILTSDQVMPKYPQVKTLW